MDRYIRFTNEAPMKRFVEDAKKHKWDKEIKKLKAELASARDLSAVSNSEVRSHNISSPTEQSAITAANIMREIARRESYKDIMQKALEDLTFDEREIFCGFHFATVYVSRFVDDYANMHNCSPRHVYTLKREAEDAFCEAVLALKGKYPCYR